MSNLTHHHILLFAGDYERLADFNQGKPGILIRTLVHRYIQSVESKLQEATENGPIDRHDS